TTDMSPTASYSSFPARRSSDLPGRREDGGQVGFVEHVRDRVVDEDGVEGLVDPYCAHVSGDVSTFGMEPARHGEHVLGAIDEGRSEEHTSELQSRENLVCRLPL